MTTVLSPSGVELPDGGDPHSRAQVNRNFTKINDLWNLVNKIKHAEYTSTSVTATNANTNYEFGNWTVTTDSTTQNNTFSQNDTNAYRIKINENGVYAVDLLIKPTSDPGSLNLNIKRFGVSEPVASNPKPAAYGDWERTVNNSNIYLSVGDILLFNMQASNAGVAFTGRFRITKLQG